MKPHNESPEVSFINSILSVKQRSLYKYFRSKQFWQWISVMNSRDRIELFSIGTNNYNKNVAVKQRKI